MLVTFTACLFMACTNIVLCGPISTKTPYHGPLPMCKSKEHNENPESPCIDPRESDNQLMSMDTDPWQGGEGPMSPMPPGAQNDEQDGLMVGTPGDSKPPNKCKDEECIMPRERDNQLMAMDPDDGESYPWQEGEGPMLPMPPGAQNDEQDSKPPNECKGDECIMPRERDPKVVHYPSMPSGAQNDGEDNELTTKFPDILEWQEFEVSTPPMPWKGNEGPLPEGVEN